MSKKLALILPFLILFFGNYYVGVASSKACCGLTKDEVRAWREAGFTVESRRIAGQSKEQPSEMETWHTAGFKVSEATVWRPIVIQLQENPYWAKEWHDLGFHPSEALDWGSENFTPSSTRLWMSVGLTVDEAADWVKKVGTKDVLSLIRAGVTSDEAYEWRKIFPDSKNILIWRLAGYSPQESALWTFADTPTAATKWKQAGFTPEQALNWSNKIPSPENALQARNSLKKDCPGPIKTLEELLSTNPYDTKGKCYEVTGDTFQLLSRTKALYDLDDGNLAIVDFGTRSAPQYLNAIVKGTGATSYATVLGANKTVPVLRPILEFNQSGHHH